MSEGAFLLAALGLLLSLEKNQKKAAAGWLVFLTLCRTAALALVPAAAARSIQKRRWKDAALVCLPGLAAFAAWSAWSHAVSGIASQKVEELGVAYSAGLGSAAVAVENARYYLSSLGASFLPAPWVPAAPFAGLVFLAVFLRGAARLWRKDRWEPALWLLAGTAALHAVWPWHYERYLIMPLPFLLWGFAEGLGRRALPIMSVLLATQLFFQSLPWLTHDHAWRTPELARTYDWLDEHSGPSDIVSSVMYLRDGFLTSRPARPLPAAADAASLHETLKSGGVAFVLWQEELDLGVTAPDTSVVRDQLRRDEAGLRDSRLFRLLYEDHEEHARVYAVL
jgi:hypothetical protein